jgi:hypothetical protein
LSNSIELQGGLPYSVRTGTSSLLLGRALLQLGEVGQAQRAETLATTSGKRRGFAGANFSGRKRPRPFRRRPAKGVAFARANFQVESGRGPFDDARQKA